MQEVGFVIKNQDYLVYLDGLPNIQINDLVANEQGVTGWVNAIMEDRVEVLLLNRGRINPKQIFTRQNTSLTINVGEFLLGRAINPLGIPIDGKKPLIKTKTNTIFKLDKEASGIDSRRIIDTQLVTGITLIDTLIPLGKGQRQLIIGDAHSGKTTFLTDLIINQKNTNMICIYAMIGKSATMIKNLIDVLNTNQAMAKTIIIATSSQDPAPLTFLTPEAVFTVAEYFQKQGMDVLIILDDMGNHAKIYREISLLSSRIPARESYPGDIFYQHSHLVERAGYFKPEFGGGSITALPVIEINLDDFTTFVPTNLMAMTDGHILFRSSIYNKGQRPAVDISLSVTRVGRQTQTLIQNQLSSKVRQLMTQAEQLETVSKFSLQLPPESQLILRQKGLIDNILNQEPLTNVPLEIQLILLALVFSQLLQDKTPIFISQHKRDLSEAFLKVPNLYKITKVVTKFKSADDLIKTLDSAANQLEQICT